MNNIFILSFLDNFNVAIRVNRWEIQNGLSCMVFDGTTGVRGMTLRIFSPQSTQRYFEKTEKK